MIKALIFDLGGVVFRYRPDDRLSAFAAATGLNQQAIHNRLFASGYSESCDRGRLDHEAAFREGVRLLDVRMSRERFGELWSRAFVPDETVINIVRFARERYTLALLTNNSKLVKTELQARHPDVLDLFRPQIFSADLGWRKPDPRMFDTTLTMMDLQPDEALFIDDSGTNINSAASIGMAVHHFTGAEGLATVLAGYS